MQNLQQPSLKLKGDQVHIQTRSVKAFKAYPFIIAVMAVLQVSGILYSRYWIDIHNSHLPLGTLLCTPLILYIFQIVSECYGWQYGRQIMWINLIINLLFTLITFTVSFIPISNFTHIGLSTAYNSLMNTVWLSALMSAIAIFFAEYFATILMVKSRLYFHGNLVFLRVILIQCITEMVLLSTSFIIMPYNGYSLPELYHAMLQTFISRTVYATALAPISVFMIWVIQHYIEKVVCFDVNPDWNVFDWQIHDRSTVKISTKDWDALPKDLKNQINIVDVSKNIAVK